MRVRWFVAIALLGGVGVAGWWWSLRQPAPLRPAAHIVTQGDSTVPAFPPVAAESAKPTRNIERNAKSSKHWWDRFVPGIWEQLNPAPTPRGKFDVATIPVDGVVVVTDGEGREHLEESGTLHLFFARPEPANLDAAGGGPSESVSARPARALRSPGTTPIRKGRFHVDVPVGLALGADEVRVGGRLTIVDSRPETVEAGRSTTIRVHTVDGVRVHVVDRGTGNELEDVVIVRAGYKDEVLLHPGDPSELEPVLQHAKSPVVIPPHEYESKLELRDHVWICARDHAWRRVGLDFTEKRERTVELAAAATLVVDVLGELTRPDERSLGDENDEERPMLRLRRPAERPSAGDANLAGETPGAGSELEGFRRRVEFLRRRRESEPRLGELVTESPARIGANRIESIEASDLIVSIEIGWRYRSPRVLASSPTNLISGTTTNVTLVVAPVEKPATVPLAGSVYVPDGWNRDKIELQIEPIDLAGSTSSDHQLVGSWGWTSISGRNGWYRWNARNVRPAKYAIQVGGAGISKIVDVAAPGNREVEIVLPEPVTLRVRIVGASDDNSLKSSGMQWIPDSDELSTEFPMGVGLDYDATTQTYACRVAAGMGLLDLFSNDDWVLDDDPFVMDLHPGEQEIVAHVHATCGFVIEFVGASRKLDWHEYRANQARVASKDGKGRANSVSFIDAGPSYSVTLPGRYTVKLHDLDDYEPVAPFEIDVPAGRFVTKTVELRKRR